MAEERNQVPITEGGLADVRKELNELIEVRRPDVIQKIKAAREHGDLSENFEYHAARNEQSFLESRIQELEAIVRNHVLVESQGDTGVVEVLGTVTVQEESGPEETYVIVPPAEADPVSGKISYESAMGRALLGHREGEEVEVEPPTGAPYSLRIVSIS
ncbi:MAG: transcription elongation factor GreA [Candidatus Dormibacteraeota bacterium]|nr:transcription elongation factor GreA [Candidatus Dormibacteraeota bacterium]